MLNRYETVRTRRSAAGRRGDPRSWLRLGVAPLALAAALAPGWWSEVRQWPGDGALSALTVLPVLAAAVAWQALRREPAGPPIHDRQLDLIVTFFAAVGAAELLHLAQGTGSGSFAAAGAACLMAIAIVAAGWGTRALWQVRWAVVLLALTWQEPWAALVDAVWPAVRSTALAVGDAQPWADARPVDGRVLAVAGDTSGALDPAAGGSVLLLVLVGTLVGLAAAAGRRSFRRALLTALAGALAGGLAAIVTWLAATATGTADWSEGTTQGVALGVLAVAAVVVLVGRALWRPARARPAPEPPVGAAASTRLKGAVPRVWVSTGVIAALTVGFVLLQLDTSSSTSIAPAPSAAGLR